MKRTAIFDEHLKYRYSLTREWDESKGKVVFIMLNPSLADDKDDDRTTLKSIKFANKFGYGSLEIVNLFAYITPNYRELKNLDRMEAIGNKNQNYLIRALNSADKIIAAWGENGTIHQRHKEIDRFIDGYDIDCLGTLTKQGHPRHPLFLSYEVELLPYKRPKKKVRRFVRTGSKNKFQGEEGVLIRDGKKVHSDSWMWCESCHEDFRIAGSTLCESCFESQMEGFMEFMMQEYRISEGSAKDYVGRFKGIVNKGIYEGDNRMAPTLREAIRKEFPNSKNHYLLALERYFEFREKLGK